MYVCDAGGRNMLSFCRVRVHRKLAHHFRLHLSADVLSQPVEMLSSLSAHSLPPFYHYSSEAILKPIYLALTRTTPKRTARISYHPSASDIAHSSC